MINRTWTIWGVTKVDSINSLLKYLSLLWTVTELITNADVWFVSHRYTDCTHHGSWMWVRTQPPVSTDFIFEQNKPRGYFCSTQLCLGALNHFQWGSRGMFVLSVLFSRLYTENVSFFCVKEGRNRKMFNPPQTFFWLSLLVIFSYYRWGCCSNVYKDTDNT